uniref:Anoctamin n=1 Tax=Palpitomonas bilix TaxID=652834 RepID=A0A7S3GJL3_9EUKA|mmetsp:Transcript_6399/g.15723  ORF Transcript_6399/g.15723 Transcript_6399/m.15723 type:complete len:823 (+) Transcript_6399:116-2584(+)
MSVQTLDLSSLQGRDEERYDDEIAVTHPSDTRSAFREEYGELTHRTIKDTAPRFEYCMSWPKNDDGENSAERADMRTELLEKLAECGLIYSLTTSRDNDEVFCRIAAPMDRLEIEAERLGLSCPEKPIQVTQPGITEDELKKFTRGKAVKKEFSPEAGARHQVNYVYSRYTRKESNKFQYGGDFHAFTRRRQYLINHIIQSTKPGCCGIDTDRYISKKILKSYFPLHETEVRKWLLQHWVKYWKLPSPINFQHIRDYFSEKTGLYFAFLDFYTKALLIPTVIGLAVFALQIVVTVNSDSNGVDGAISVWSQNTVITPFFCVLLILWAALFIKMWTRKSNTITFQWGSFAHESKERNRPNFRGLNHPRFNKYTAKYEEYYPVGRRYAKMLVGAVPMLAVIVGAAIAYVQVYLLKVYLYSSAELPSIVQSVLAGGMTAVLIMVLNQVYRRIAKVLNNWENHRLQSKYENHLIGKIMAFGAINNYMSLFYIAFSTEYRGIVCSDGSRCLNEEISDPSIRSEDCEVCVDSVNRMQSLGQQLLFVLLFKQVLNNVIEIGIPFLKKFVKSQLEKRALKKQHKDVSKQTLSRAGQESKWAEYDTFGDYEEMVIQFGFVVLFACAFPAAGIFALINNVVEVHVDGYKLCTEFRRPKDQRASSIGTWLSVLRILTFLSVITNTLILGYTSDSLEKLLAGITAAVASYTDSNTSWVLVAIAIEHVLILGIAAIFLFIGDVPRPVLKEMEGLAAYARKKRIEQLKKGYAGEEEGELEKIAARNKRQYNLSDCSHEAPTETRDDSEFMVSPSDIELEIENSTPAGATRRTTTTL